MAPASSTVLAPSSHSLLPYLSYPTVQSTLVHSGGKSIERQVTIGASYISSNSPPGTSSTARPAVTIYALTDTQSSLSPSRNLSINSSIAAIALSVTLFNLLCVLAFIVFTRLKLRQTVKNAFYGVFGVNRKLRMTPTEEELIEAKGSLDLRQTRRASEKTKMSDTSLLEQQCDNNSPTPPSSIISDDTRIVQVNATSPHTQFEQHAEEVDITSNLVFALRDCPHIGENNRSREYSPQPDPTGILEDRHANYEPENKKRQESDASYSSQAESDIFSNIATHGSSQTSISRIDHNSESGSEQAAELSSEEIAFEVAQAQTQSMEIKRGILLNWTPHTLSPIPEDIETTSPPSTGLFPGYQEIKAQVPVPFTVPSLLVTCPSTVALSPITSSSSSISVDLTEFPKPPFDGREFLERICKF